MILHRHEFVRFLRENPDAMMITCHCSECPIATWLDSVNPQHTHHVKLNRIVRSDRITAAHVDSVDTPSWAHEFIKAVDTDLDRRPMTPASSAYCLEVLNAIPTDA